MKKTAKRVGIFVAMLFLIYTNSNAQDLASNEIGAVSYGTKMGFSSSNFSQNYQRDKMGFAIGGFGKYQIEEYMGIELDIFYTQEGANQVNPNVIYDANSISINNINKVNSNITLNTISIPLLLSFNAPDMGDVSPKILVGGAFDYYMSATTENLIHDQSNNLIITGRKNDIVSSSFKSYNYCLVTGLGIDFGGDKLGYSLEFRYKMGLRSINNLAQYNINNNFKEDFSTNVLQILVGISF